MNIQDYEIIKILGKGTQGSVVKAIRQWDKKTIAIKIINVPQGSTARFNQVTRETDLLEKLNDPVCNPFVICYENSYYDIELGKFYIEMEYVEGKDLEKFIDNLRKNNSNEAVYYYLLLIAKDVTQGLQYIHSKGIIHNDIKPANIVIDTKYTPRIVDFGLSCKATHDKIIGDYCKNNSGTPFYFAPEIILSSMHLPASDIWALGVTLFRTAIQNGYPYVLSPKVTKEELFEIIIDKEPEKLETSNSQLNTLVNNILVKDATRRWKEPRILEHLKTIDKPQININVPIVK